MSAFSTYSFGKLIFRLSVLFVFFCFESNVLNQDFKQICSESRLLANIASETFRRRGRTYIPSEAQKFNFKI